MNAKLLAGCAVVWVGVSCNGGREPQRACDVTGGWELGAHDPTDRSTNVYLTERGSGAVDLDQDVRRADGTHGWEVEHGRHIDDRHFEFHADGGEKERCEVATTCDRIECTSFALVHHFCTIDGDWHATFARGTGTARLTSRRDDLDLELVGEHTQRIKGLRFAARKVIVHFAEGDARCDISETCDRVVCTSPSFELRR